MSLPLTKFADYNELIFRVLSNKSTSICDTRVKLFSEVRDAISSPIFENEWHAQIEYTIAPGT